MFLEEREKYCFYTKMYVLTENRMFFFSRRGNFLGGFKKFSRLAIGNITEILENESSNASEPRMRF